MSDAPLVDGRTGAWEVMGETSVGAHLYILRCADGRYYVGSTRESLQRRVAEHNAGTFAGEICLS
jgi:hypothetical protein